MIVLGITGQIGAKALYLLFVWLAAAAGAAWVSDRKGYTERVGLTFGLVLSFVGFFIVLLLPARPGSVWKLEGPRPRRHRAGPGAGHSAPTSDASSPGDSPPPPSSPPPAAAA